MTRPVLVFVLIAAATLLPRRGLRGGGTEQGTTVTPDSAFAR
ncbi:MAG: hypothetical protein U0361_20235 [Nitrospiraceae bacterium]